MNLENALADLRAHAVPGKADEMAAYHKVRRPYLGLPNPAIEAEVKAWRAKMTVAQRVTLARDLWASNIHEARIAAAKLLTQARLRPDDDAWALIQSWVPEFDGWALADHAAIAGQKRLMADPARMADLAPWTRSDHMWTRRAVLVMTLPWTKQNHPKPADMEIRARVLGWAGEYAEDHNRLIQKAIAWWLRDLSKHDEGRVRDFLAEHGEKMKGFARKEAARHLK